MPALVRLAKKRVGVQHRVAQVLIRFAMECIGTGLGAHVDHAAGVHAEFRGVVVRLRVEFLNDVLVHDQFDRVAVGRIHRRAIDKHGALVGIAAVNLVVAGGKYVLAARGWSKELPCGTTPGTRPRAPARCVPLSGRVSNGLPSTAWPSEALSVCMMGGPR